jgi:hypothetical protein
MIHNPCGNKNENSPCMKNGRCSKYYPKEFQHKTNFTDEALLNIIDEIPIFTYVEKIIT